MLKPVVINHTQASWESWARRHQLVALGEAQRAEVLAALHPDIQRIVQDFLFRQDRESDRSAA